MVYFHDGTEGTFPAENAIRSENYLETLRTFTWESDQPPAEWDGADDYRYQLTTKEALPLTNSLFAEDALIVENGQVHSVCLMDKEKRPWLTVHFDAPVVGLWSPPQKNAPFVCIEPWYGRCDESGYRGEFADKEWMQKLAAGEQFHASYIIEIANR